jgi:ligand-binding sensor domain-containing protein
MSFFIKIALFFILLLQITNCFSQIYNFKTYNEDNGLPQNYIYSISQTSDGFLYLSTGNGFSAFGGNKFKTFTSKDSLCENFVNIHFNDSRGIIWLGHYQNGISYLKDSKFYKIKNSESLASKVISFTEDRKKNIWFVVQGIGIFYIDSAFTIQKPEFNEVYFFNCISVDNSGNLLSGTDNGLLYFDIKNEQKPKLICKHPELENKNIKFITKDALSSFFYWLAIPGEGVYGMKKANNKYNVSTIIAKELNSTTKNIACIYSDKSSNLWISLSEEGLKKIVFTGNKDFYKVQTINHNNGLHNLYIQSIFQDFEENMWFGTFGGGLIQMPVERFVFLKPELDSDIKSILIDNYSNILLGTQNGLVVYDLLDNTKTKIFDSKNGFVNDKVNALFQDKSGVIWIGTEQNGLFTLNSESWKFENYSKKNKLSSLSVNCISQNKSLQIVIGTKEGVYFVNPKTLEIVLVTTIEGLLHNNVVKMMSDTRNRLWLCSKGTPPYYLDNDEFNVIKDIPELQILTLNSYAEDRNGLIWISTEGDGILCYDGKNTKNFRVEDGLVSNYCYSVICSNDNELWVTHKNGLTCIKQSGKSFVRYTKNDGLLFNENNLNSCFKDKKGNIWLGTTEGIVLCNTDQNKIKINEPKTQILLLTLNNKIYTNKDIIDLSYDNYSVKVDYIGISLTDPSKVSYKYRLLGLDTTWRKTNERFIEYSKISDGIYTFQVLACNRDGIWNTKPVEISFEINEPYWKKIWFWFLIFILLIGIVFILTQIRTNNLIKAKLILEKKVEVKTQQLREEKEQIEKIKIILEEKNKDITDSINYAKRIQVALMPSKHSFIKEFPRTFIYFKPRDIVSGDFYWFGETHDSYIIAVVDCTGHGVPGAFMSLIGSTLLNEILANKNISSPAKILTELNSNVIKALSQDHDISSSRDGMDISMASINKTKTKMLFSSAARPMYYVRNQVLHSVNLRTQSIGSSYTNIVKKYTDVEIDLLPNDIFYFFSDGFIDQFDEHDEKKFSSARIKKMFLKIADMESCFQLNEVEKTFNTWRGNVRQIDDVTVIGVKI